MTKCQKNKSGQDYIQLMITKIKGKETQKGVIISSNLCVYYFGCEKKRPLINMPKVTLKFEKKKTKKTALIS